MNVVARILAIAFLSLAWSATAAEAHIIKVLPHFLDKEGRISIHPSLFERDGYQARLKLHPELCSGMRFDVQWKGRKLKNGRLRLEVRGSKTPARQIATFENELSGGGLFSHWSGLRVSGEDFNRLGSIVAWRITIWDGDEELGEERSFLW